jgi:arylsulfatase A-like enzyme
MAQSNHTQPEIILSNNRRFQTELTLVAFFCAMVIVVANWYLVDPFQFRILPTFLLATLSGLSGLLLGFLFLISLQTLWPKCKNMRLDLIPGFLAIWLLLFFLIRLQPAPNRFSAAQLDIRVDNQLTPVWLEYIKVGGDLYSIDQCKKSGAWEAVDGLMKVDAGDSASLNCMLAKPGGESVEIVLGSTTIPAVVQVRLGSVIEQFELGPVSGSQVARLTFRMPPNIGAEIVIVVRIMDALFLLLLVTGILQSDLNRYQFLGAQLVKISAWFDDTTPRLRIVTLSVGLICMTLTLLLFLLPHLPPSSTTILKRDNRPLPNVIFIVVDSLAANDMSLFGYSLPTTLNLEKATQDWTVYTHAQSPLTCTIAALPVFLTGRYPNLNVYSNYGDHTRSQAGWLNEADILRDNGYHTWWSGYISPSYYHLGSGFERSVCRPNNFLHTTLNQSWFQVRAITMEKFPYLPYTLDTLDLAEESREDFEDCASVDPLEELLQSGQVQDPFYIYYHYRGVHGNPYPINDSLGAFLPLDAGMLSRDSQRPYFGLYNPVNQDMVDQLRMRYDEVIKDQDKKLADLIEQLKQKGFYDSSLIIITADHGQSFKNGISSHCTSLISDVEAHVPLLIKYPGQTVGRRVDFLVSTLDVIPTILTTAGFTYLPDWFDGIALYPDEERDEPGRIIFTSRPDLFSGVLTDIAVTDGRFRLVLFDNQKYLYELSSDPLETNNLIDQPGYADQPGVQRLIQAMDNYLTRLDVIRQGQSILTAPALNP